MIYMQYVTTWGLSTWVTTQPVVLMRMDGVSTMTPGETAKHFVLCNVLPIYRAEMHFYLSLLPCINLYYCTFYPKTGAASFS